MQKRLLTLTALVVLGLSLAGCGKCGWFWEGGPRSCHNDAAPK